MAKSIVGVFDRRSDALDVVRELIDSGFHRDDISLIGENVSGKYVQPTITSSEGIGGVAVGASTGAVLGGIGGLLVGLGALVISGIGPVIAAGPLATALLGAGMGAAAGGLVGALVEVGVPEQEAEYYAEGIRRGSTLVAVKTDDEMMIDRAVNIFERHNTIDIDRRVEEWRQSGWTSYDPAVGPYIAPSSPSWKESQQSVGLSKFEDYDGDFHNNFTETYSKYGYTYDRYEPAYHYGYMLAKDTRYSGKDWAAIEGEAQHNWETSHHGAWQDFKDAIRYAWDRVRGYSAAEASAHTRKRNAA